MRMTWSPASSTKRLRGEQTSQNGHGGHDEPSPVSPRSFLSKTSGYFELGIPVRIRAGVSWWLYLVPKPDDRPPA